MRPLRLAAIVSLALASAGAAAIGARAQVTVPTLPLPTTTAPPPSSTTTVTTEPAGQPAPGPAPTTPTTVKDQGPGPGPLAPARAGAERGDTPGDPRPGDPKVVPPSARAAIGAVKRSGPNSTRKLLEALRPLQGLGLSQEEAIQLGFGRFPVGGYAHYSHDWLYPRFTPTFHLHEGTDVFAAFGTPVRSPADGTLRQTEGAVGGLAAYVHEPNGTFYYLAHLQGFVPGQRSGQRVKVGDVIGYNGDSGNARGGSPHVHFEVHPRGGGPADPKPYLDRWLDEALAGVPRLIESLEAGRPRALIATGLTRHLATGGLGTFVAPVSPPRPQLLWAFSASPPGGALRMAEAEAAVAARAVDWSELARRRAGRMEAQRRAEATSRSVLAPLTPPSLRGPLGLA